MIELHTERLKLREFAAEDLDKLAEIDAEPTTRGFAWEGPLDRETVTANLEGWIVEYGRGLGHLAMILGPDGDLIGHCGLTEQEGHLMLSYALRKEYWCMGLAPEACRAILAYGFKELGLEEIRTATGAENHAWRSMMERLGMELHGSMRAGSGEEMVSYAATRERFGPTEQTQAASR